MAHRGAQTLSGTTCSRAAIAEKLRVDPSYVSKVASGDRHSTEVRRAILEELRSGNVIGKANGGMVINDENAAHLNCGNRFTKAKKKRVSRMPKAVR